MTTEELKEKTPREQVKFIIDILDSVDMSASIPTALIELKLNEKRELLLNFKEILASIKTTNLERTSKMSDDEFIDQILYNIK